MDTHNGFTVFTYQKDRIVFDAFDNIDASLPFVPEFLARFYDEDNFLYHKAILPAKGREIQEGAGPPRPPCNPAGRGNQNPLGE